MKKISEEINCPNCDFPLTFYPRIVLHNRIMKYNQKFPSDQNKTDKLISIFRTLQSDELRIQTHQMVPFFNVIDYGYWLTTYKSEYCDQCEIFFSIYLKVLRHLHIPYDSNSKISIKDNLLELKDQLTQYVQKYAIKLDFFDFSLSDPTSLDIHSQMPTFYYLYSYINNPEFDFKRIPTEFFDNQLDIFICEYKKYSYRPHKADLPALAKDSLTVFRTTILIDGSWQGKVKDDENRFMLISWKRLREYNELSLISKTIGKMEEFSLDDFKKLSYFLIYNIFETESSKDNEYDTKQ